MADTKTSLPNKLWHEASVEKRGSERTKRDDAQTDRIVLHLKDMKTTQLTPVPL